MKLIAQPGVYDLNADAYHADPVVEPSLSASIAHVLVEQTPRHAWLQHPRLNPAFERKHKREFDIGSAAHALLLGSRDLLRTVGAKNYKTKAAREARDLAYERNEIPLLPHELAECKLMVETARRQLVKHEDAAFCFSNGKPEQSLVWQEGEIWCRSRLDWLPAGGNVFFDYKSTGASAHPDSWGSRTLFEIGADIEAAFHLRGVRKVLGIQYPHFRFVVQETDPPYALSVIELDGQAMEQAEEKVEAAIAWWRWCTRSEAWPGYPKRVAFVSAPVWRQQRWADWNMRDQMLKEAGEDLHKLMLDWQAPLDHDKGEAA